MPFEREPLLTIAERIKARTELKVRDAQNKAVDAHTKGSGWTEWCEVCAGMVYELQGRQVYIANQILINSASEETLVSRAAELDIPRIQPFYAAGDVLVLGDNAVLIAAGTVLQANNGEQYQSLADATTAGNEALFTLRALKPGALANLAAGTSLTFITPIPGLDTQVTVEAGGITGGADLEDVERLRTRLGERVAQPPMGGNRYDYVAWAKAAHVDVTRVFPFFHEDTIGDIVIRFVTEDLADPIPTAPHVTAVFDYIDDIKPAGTANFTVEAPAAKPLDLVFTQLSPNTPEQQAAIDAELADLLRREGECNGVLLLSHIREAISNAPGEVDFAITLATNFLTDPDEFPTLGVTTWPAP
jgi:uncharacterized phage protein gp47/JayE